MNSCVDSQIKAAFENNGMSPEEIAQEFDFDVVAVKAKLMQVSSVYRKACNQEPDEVEDGLNFTNDQLRRINEQIYANAIGATLPDGSPDFKTMQRACEYIRDDKKGRRDAAKHFRDNPFNLIQFNQVIQQSRVMAEEAKKQIRFDSNGHNTNGHNKIIEVTSK